MYWGVYPALLRLSAGDTFDNVLRRACNVARSKGFVENDDDKFVVTAGLPFGCKGAANVVRVMFVCVCVCMCACVYVCMYTHTHTHTHAHTHVCMYAYI